MHPLLRETRVARSRSGPSAVTRAPGEPPEADAGPVHTPLPARTLAAAGSWWARSLPRSLRVWAVVPGHLLCDPGRSRSHAPFPCPRPCWPRGLALPRSVLPVHISPQSPDSNPGLSAPSPHRCFSLKTEQNRSMGAEEGPRGPASRSPGQWGRVPPHCFQLEPMPEFPKDPVLQFTK